MNRLFTQKLETWKDTIGRKPLIIRGARQVGKSFTVASFGKNNFNGRIHTVDFEKHPDWHGIFEKNLDPHRIVSELEILLNAKITAGTDLLFFDEIQAAPKAIMALRYFYEEMPGLHVIAAGSLLEFAMKDISFPVGRVSLMNMSPMNFYEYLKACQKDKLAEIVLSEPEKLPGTIHQALLDNLREYMYVGGMPQCVNVWHVNRSMAEVFDIQNDLAGTYRQDFSKYAPYVDKRSLNQVLGSVASNIGHQVIYTRMSVEFTGPTNKKALDLLTLARVVSKVNSASPASLPLAATSSDKRFKAILVDTGILRALNQLPANIEFMKNDLLQMYHGALAEQFAGQEFISSGQENLFYWSREAKSSSAEVDYLVVKNGSICPVEIKGGAAGKLRSLHVLLKEYPKIERGYVLSIAPFGEIPSQKIVFLPLYYAYGLLRQ
ncbi:MAG TPA: AAA family ATPase [Bacteroidales bacterium]|jgi:predicted AAA+ superfamily ATPase|nr:ATP-binding protein [Bacteroidales bacterium]MDX9905191.1 AAA family ATPase [Bacteroidales bacterium]HOX78077.1 AAA family ATPase [Bacteroidales bacterium]HPI85140.1 AAA family ATPase [Bacteroidales bacterium]HPM93095.1 AAA family ATPase [Bacteroidales bacterium]